MISWEKFETEVKNVLNRDISNNINQKNAVIAPQNQSLFIVAGPGSGKTTVIVLKVLKLIFVDNIDPSTILITTFTKKAAAELRSRILGWGDLLKSAFLKNLDNKIKNKIQKIDINRINTGTLDNLTEEVLSEFREPGTPSPAVVEDFVSNALMVRLGIFNNGRYTKQELKSALGYIQGSNWGLNVPGMTDTLIEIKERLYHDQIDFEKFKNAKIEGIDIVSDSIIDYILELENRYLYDFASLEQEFLKRLKSGRLNNYLKEIKFILVDEYQDTNLLQEQIYLEIARAAITNKGSITIVGDDDQSLYRFRGATVTLFQKFEDRIDTQLRIKPLKIFLNKNYRSTSNIVDFCNEFITLDSKFQSARVKDKPPIIGARSNNYTNYPILGMFREDLDILASDLSKFIYKVVKEKGIKLKNNLNIKVDSNGGSPVDIAILCNSPREYGYNNKKRLPLLVRENLKKYPLPIKVFNPRGQSLEAILDVQILCGLLLECIDPECHVQDNNHFPKFAIKVFNEWREVAQNYIEKYSNTGSQNLSQFMDAWRSKRPLGRKQWEKNVSLVNIVYKLITWIPKMQNDIEGLVYLESITRTINQASLFSTFKSEIIYDKLKPELTDKSIKDALRNIFIPLASGAIDINEELLETLPQDRLNLMSIHQAKGLEFPLVIVDVGSDFKNLNGGAFKRFPRDGGHTCTLEDNLRSYCELGTPSRNSLDRAFDDLIRQYFVGFSRAQDVLLLVGLNSVKNGYYVKSGYREIPNIATGWNRNKEWIWDQGLKNLYHI